APGGGAKSKPISRISTVVSEGVQRLCCAGSDVWVWTTSARMLARSHPPWNPAVSQHL
ncbi:hypothetical protein CRUP_035276, partial [Coryphaenoides rupestris]